MTGTPVIEALRIVLDDLSAKHVRCAVVGGLAVSARTVPRFTRDVDLAVSVASDAEAEAVVAGLLERGYRVLGQLEHAETGRLATVRLIVRPAAPDARGGDEEREAPVARRGHLIALKLLSARDPRPQDSVDLAALLDGAAAADLELARATLGTIRQRGFHRGKDLLAELERALARNR